MNKKTTSNQNQSNEGSDMNRLIQHVKRACSTGLVVMFLLSSVATIEVNAFQLNTIASSDIKTQGQIEVREAGDAEALLVTLNVKNMELAEVLKRLTRQAGVGLSYDAEIVLGIRVTKKVIDKPLFSLLDELLVDTKLEYSISEDARVLVLKQLSTENNIEADDQMVTGTVVDGNTGEALPGVNIALQGSTIGTSTNNEGEYELNLETLSGTLIFSYIGYQNEEVDINGRNEINIELLPQAVSGDEIVVTALNLDREKTRLGYSIQSVSGSDLANSTETNVVNALSGMASGINVTNAGGNIGSSTRIVIRGESSIMGNNQPLFVIDGTPVNNSNIKSGTGSGFRPSPSGSRSAIDFGNAISDLNPADIESISILKGPNAAALYGSRAANGVVQIKTKDGRGIDGFQVTVNSSVSFKRPMTLPDYQDEYGQGSGDNFEYVDGSNGVGDGIDSSFGPPLDEGLEFVQFNSGGEPSPWISHPNNVKDFFETGTRVSNRIAVAGGSNEVDYKLSVSNNNETGMLPNTDLRKNNISLNAGAELSDKFNVRTSINYTKTKSDNRMGGGYDDQNVMKSFLWFGRQVDIPALYDQYQEYGNDLNWNTSWHNNPYFVLYENTNSLDRNRFVGNVSFTYNFTDRLSLSLRGGNDFYNDIRSLRRAYNDFEFPNGAFTEDVYRVSEQNYDFLLTGDQSLNNNFSFGYSAGGNWFISTLQQNKVQANQLAVPGVYNVSNAKGIPNAINWYEEKQIYSLYGLTEIGFKEYLFLEITGRNDWTSTLPLDNNSYFYPSVSLSALLSEVLDLGDAGLNYAKIRGSYAQVGSDTDPYQNGSVYNSSVSSWGSFTTVTEPNVIPNENLKPQITESLEMGVDLQFFDGMVDFDFTWYKSTTKNQIIQSSIANSSGYSQRFFNAGKIENKGFEITTHLRPLSENFPLRWDVDINYSRNRNKVIELAEGIDRIQLPGGSLFGLDVVVIEGHPYGVLYGKGMKRNEDGEIIFKPNGRPQLTDTGEIQGSYQPKWTGSLSNSFNYKSVRLGVLIDGKFGGQIYSGTNVVGRRAGILESTLPGREDGIIGDGVVENGDGTYSKNTTKVNAKSWYSGYYAYDNTEVSVFDANYVKLRELSLSYSLPQKILQSLPASSANISLVGRNLLFLYNSVPNIDPETAIASDSPQGLEVGQIPTPRSVSLNLSLSF